MGQSDPLRKWSVHRIIRGKPDVADGQRHLSIVVPEVRATRLKLFSEVLSLTSSSFSLNGADNL
jgi:hypothetical protein